ncbi:enoyl-CoA hydratase-related protein [Mycobacterium tuberculosis]
MSAPGCVRRSNAPKATATYTVVVTGAGGAFCTRGRPGVALGARVAIRTEIVTALRRTFMAVGDLICPTIAAVNGAAVSRVHLALAADVRIAGPAALFDATSKAGTASRWRRNLDAAADGGSTRSAVRPYCSACFDARIRCAARLGANGCRRSRHRGAGAGCRARSRPRARSMLASKATKARQAASPGSRWTLSNTNSPNA